MLLYDSVGPNPRFVRMFAAERGITLPKVTVDLRGGENRQAPYLAKNPSGYCGIGGTGVTCPIGVGVQA